MNRRKALEELKKLPDDLTEYAPKTETLLKSFGQQFPEAAQLIRKSPQAMQLVQEAAKADVKFGGYAEEHEPHTPRAHTRIEDQHVYIDIPKAATDPIIAARDFLFELNNGINSPRFREISNQVGQKDQAGQNMITAEAYAHKHLEIEVEAMLKTGEIWSQMKGACKDPTKLNEYNLVYFLWLYQDHQKGTISSKEDIAKLLYSTAEEKPHKQFYEEQHDRIRNAAAQQ